MLRSCLFHNLLKTVLFFFSSDGADPENVSPLGVCVDDENSIVSLGLKSGLWSGTAVRKLTRQPLGCAGKVSREQSTTGRVTASLHFQDGHRILLRGRLLGRKCAIVRLEEIDSAHGSGDCEGE
jgi:hypothetical protein